MLSRDGGRHDKILNTAEEVLQKYFPVFREAVREMQLIEFVSRITLDEAKYSFEFHSGLTSFNFEITEQIPR